MLVAMTTHLEISVDYLPRMKILERLYHTRRAEPSGRVIETTTKEREDEREREGEREREREREREEREREGGRGGR